MSKSSDKKVANRVIEGKTFHLLLITGQNSDDLDIFCYAVVRGDKLENFQALLKAGNINIKEHALVLGSGFGIKPPALLELEIMEKFESGKLE